MKYMASSGLEKPTVIAFFIEVLQERLFQPQPHLASHPEYENKKASLF